MDKQKKYFYAIVLLLLGILIGYFLFSGNLITQSIVGGGGTTVSASTPTDEGDQICTRVCVPKPVECPRTCPAGTHWQCGGTVAMNCGCFPDVPVGGTTVTTLPDGPRGCLTDPSICSADYFCDTALNQCKPIGAS